ncbi:MAG: bifunctional UDP-N-acetylglucosamine diphosphorylase/glucosamine-1-phosphate N-acetyltransferase GlmU [Gammaproteobacteria bacterium]
MALSVVILAAGQGKRMHSHLPKVLHTLAGKPLLEHVVLTADLLKPDQSIIVYGHKGETLRHQLANLNVHWTQQSEQLGTGHALLQALPQIADDHRVLVLYGDVPLISFATLKNLLAATPADALGMVTAHFTDPTGFGRIIRNKYGKIIDIVEQKDLHAEQHNIHEINSGIYLFPANFLAQALPKLQNQNAQKEYYLTDAIKMAVEKEISIHSMHPASTDEVLGINDRVQLANLERAYQRQQAEKLMRQGVTLMDPNRFDLRGEIRVGQDVMIDINVIIEGHVNIGNNCIIGPNCILRNATLGDHVEIKANSVLDGAEISAHCIIGPFARIRPGTVLAPNVHVGNFVEIKNSFIGEASKVNHLTYAGDSDIGKRVNVGAGTITCNYDGVNKHRTKIGDEAFIGSNTALVAPLEIGENATIGAGSVITRNAPPHQLTVCRAQQRSIENWARPKKKDN